MKIDLFDSYHIRARLSVSIIFLAPVALSLFLCCPKIITFPTYSVLICVILALSNYLPILQRMLDRKQTHNYAVDFLMPSNSEIPQARKERYYQQLSKISPLFDCFISPNDSQEFRDCCESAVSFLREKTRDNHLVLEENINYGFCKNLHGIKISAIIICIFCNLFIGFYSIFHYQSAFLIPLENYFAFAANIVLLIFWIFGVTKKALEQAGRKYAITLLCSIDSIPEL